MLYIALCCRKKIVGSCNIACLIVKTLVSSSQRQVLLILFKYYSSRFKLDNFVYTLDKGCFWFFCAQKIYVYNCLLCDYIY